MSATGYANAITNTMLRYIEFLFLTGCRPSSAVALQWKYITDDFRTIRFEQAVVESENGLVCKKRLKTPKKRSFSVNPKLAALLQSIKPEGATGEEKVFPAPKGGWIDAHNLNNRAWHSVLNKLDSDIEYRNLYQTSHTFITAALETPIMMPDGGFTNDRQKWTAFIRNSRGGSRIYKTRLSIFGACQSKGIRMLDAYVIKKGTWVRVPR